jgi:TolA-binding protein
MSSQMNAPFADATLQTTLKKSAAAQTSFLVLPLSLCLLLTGCLETRNGSKELDEKVVLKSQVSALQKNTADTSSRFQDIEDDIRKLSGRIELNENRANQAMSRAEKSDGGAAARLKENDEKFKAYREELTRLNAEVEQLKTQMAGLAEEARRAQAQASEASSARASEKAQSMKNPYAAAEEKFDQKNWKEAILDYERYRKGNPKGKNFAAATYKIGVSFQELGLIEEAKAFYEEVISKFPKTHDADKATTRLKGLKKK